MSAPNLKEIDWAISELENSESSFPVYAKLADLYAVRDHMTAGERSATPPPISAYSAASAPDAQKVTRLYGDSDFLRLVSDADPAAAWRIVDELMENLQVVNPRVYNSVMRKLEKI